MRALAVLAEAFPVVGGNDDDRAVERAGGLESIEQQSDQYASYVCQKVKGFPAALNGNSDQDPDVDTGEPRKIGVIETSDEGFANLQQFSKIVRQKLSACGVEERRWPAFVAALDSLENSEVVRGR